MAVLATQIRLNRRATEDAQRRVAEQERLLAHLIADRAALEQELAREKLIAGQSLEASLTYHGYIAELRRRRDRLDQSIQDAERQRDRARDDLSAAFAELKKYELADAAALERRKQSEDKREQMALDEIALTIHRRAGDAA